MKSRSNEDFSNDEALESISKLLKDMALIIGGGLKEVALDRIGGINVSTVRFEEGRYETGIVDRRECAYVVQRYSTEAEAIEGHRKWAAYIRAGNRRITELGEGIIHDREVQLQEDI